MTDAERGCCRGKGEGKGMGEWEREITGVGLGGGGIMNAQGHVLKRLIRERKK